MAHNQQSIPPGRLQYNITPDIIHQISKDIPSHSDSPTDWKLLTALELQSIDIKRYLKKTTTFGKKNPKSRVAKNMFYMTTLLLKCACLLVFILEERQNEHP